VILVRDAALRLHVLHAGKRVSLGVLGDEPGASRRRVACLRALRGETDGLGGAAMVVMLTKVNLSHSVEGRGGNSPSSLPVFLLLS